MKLDTIISNTTVSVVGRILGSAFAFVGFGFIARSLGQEGLGFYATALAFGFVFSALADFGLYSFLVRAISRNGENEAKTVSYVFTLRALILIVFLGAAPFASFLFPGFSSAVRIGVAIGAGMYFFLSLNQILLAVFQKHSRLVYPAAGEVLGRGVQLGLILFFVISNPTLYSFLLAAVLGAFAQLVFGIITSRTLVGWNLALDTPFFKKTIRIAFPIGISLMFTLVYFKVDTILLSALSGPASAGIYNVAYKVLESLIFFPAMFVGVVMPLLSRYAASDKKAFIVLFQKVFNMISVFALPLVFGGLVLAQKIVVLLGGGEFSASREPFYWLLFAVGLIFFGSLFGNAVIALDLQKRAAWAYFWGMVLNIAANLVLIPQYSYNGAAAATLLTELLVTGYLFYLIFQSTRAMPSFSVFRKATVSAVFMAMALYVARDWSLVLLVPAGAGIYFTILIIFKGITWADYHFFLKSDLPRYSQEV